ncbi:GNAT family N-acetyltransferase [Ureibacillus acetophenoni]|uniref:Acetyltransferase (GNAT) family protein n=1 Tax=Ureibacillus acetophenoni TaxID=614649 RepID=A0A285UKX8_9BACL|nr:GNAT family N-acetyltransferase [Ureibacillus acetophenoni]SOC42555.1 acetyltransferase (GNAT) family protein [Ureibacillus acetophenoni]
MIITIAQKHDFTAVNLIVKEGQDEHAEALPNIFRKVKQVMPESYFNELLEDPNSDILIAKINDEIVGFAVMELVESPPFKSMTPRVYAYMHDFGVKSGFQRRGIGRLLFEACIEWSKNMGASSLELNVWEFNEKAISFYESFQMKTVSRKMSLDI